MIKHSKLACIKIVQNVCSCSYFTKVDHVEIMHLPIHKIADLEAARSGMQYLL